MSWTDALNRLYRVQKSERNVLAKIVESNKDIEEAMTEEVSEIAKIHLPKPKPYTGWKPREWSHNENFKVQNIKLRDNRNIDFNSFRIYVNENKYFTLEDTLPSFDTSESKVDFKNLKDPYCISLMAMYVLSYIGGIGLKNLNSDSKIAKSLAYFYFYYHLKKFYAIRDFSGYDFSELESITWDAPNWHKHFVWRHPQVNYTKENLGGNVRNIHVVGEKVYFERKGDKIADVGKDYLKLIIDERKGMSETGLLLFQESCQAYVYAILGSQAKTRWKIVGDGAKSLQTQKVFKNLVEEVLVQNNLTKLINGMRIAISQTKVRLDFCIGPGLELLPSDMVFIKDSPGYNNTLLIASNNQKFGSNANINSEKKTLSKTIVNSSVNAPSCKLQSASEEENNRHPIKKQVVVSRPVSKPTSTSEENVEILTGAAVIALVGRLVWVALL